jgi:hypothetical protein
MFIRTWVKCSRSSKSITIPVKARSWNEPRSELNNCRRSEVKAFMCAWECSSICLSTCKENAILSVGMHFSLSMVCFSNAVLCDYITHKVAPKPVGNRL